MKKTLAIIKDDPWLSDFEDAIVGRHEDAMRKLASLTAGKQSLSDFANAYNYYGLHRTGDGWVLREWAPNASRIDVVGDFNGWTATEQYQMQRLDNGNWELVLPQHAMKHGDLFKLHIYWPGGDGERIPAYATRVVQDEQTKSFLGTGVGSRASLPDAHPRFRA